MHVLVAGWFSFEQMGNSAGDIIARDVVCGWLRDAHISFEVAVAKPFFYDGGVEWEKADASKFTDVLFVCGPFGNGWPLTDLLTRFSQCRLIGVNISLLQSINEWNPFTLLYERDSDAAVYPDITFYAGPPKIPVVGVILVHKQKEYGKRGRHEQVNEAVNRLINSREMSVVHIDTVLENNSGGLRTPGEVEALISRMDVVITTRLHGTVLALKNGVPVIAVDPISGGAKIAKQVNSIEWPLLFTPDNINDTDLITAFSYCLTEEARLKAKECTAKAIEKINATRMKFTRELRDLSAGATGL